MPDKYYAQGTVDVKMTVFLRKVPVEGYGQTKEEAEEDAVSDVLETAQNDPSGMLSSFSFAIDDYDGDAFILSQKLSTEEILGSIEEE